MTVSRLYDIPAEVERFEQILIETGGELTPGLEQEFSDFIRGSKDKIEAGCMVMRNLETQQEASKNEASRLSNRASQFERSAERLEGLILYAVDGMGGSVKTALFTTWGQNAANQINVELKIGTDLAELAKTNPELIRVKYEVNVEAVKALVKAKSGPLSEPKADAEELEIPDIPKCFIIRWKKGIRFLRIK